MSLEFGLAVERRAEEWFLKRFGGRLFARNYRIRGGEIDLVFECPCSKGSESELELELVFVEVRARLPGNWVNGFESVGGPKQRRLSRAIRHFLANYRGDARSLRIDILDWNGAEFRHYPNVWI
jgi:Holliday junction resolvase-like predicted endonuclease